MVDVDANVRLGECTGAQDGATNRPRAVMLIRYDLRVWRAVNLKVVGKAARGMLYYTGRDLESSGRREEYGGTGGLVREVSAEGGGRHGDEVRCSL